MTQLDHAGDEGPLAAGLRRRGPVKFTLSQHEEPGRTIVSIAGEFDLLTVPRFTAEVDLIVRRGSGDLVLDLRALDFIDSAGLQILLGARRRLRRQSRHLTVVCMPGPVQRAIERTRLTETLNLISDIPPPARESAKTVRPPPASPQEPPPARARSRRRRHRP